MPTYDPNEATRRRRADSNPNQAEPSMSAPSPMPGKPAASYVKPQPAAAQSQADWQPPQNQYSPMNQGWSASQYPANQNYPAYPTQQAYPQNRPSQGIPGGQLPPQQYGAWQQGYTPVPAQSQTHQQPTGRGWSQPYPNQSQNTWQGGYSVSQWNGNGYTPVYEDAPVQGGRGGNGSSGGTGGRHPLDRGTIMKLIVAAVVVVIAIALVVGLMIRQNQVNALHAAVNAYNDRYCEGVYVDGIHLGGMTREEANAAVQKSAQLKCDEWHVQLVTSDGTYVDEINSYDLGMTVHVDDALEEAWKQGHTGATVNERKAAMDALLVTPYEGSTALPSGNTSEIDRILSEIETKIYVPAKDAYAKFDPSANLASPFTYEPEVVGQYLNVASIKEQVYDMVARMESGVITIEPTPIYPNYTTADVMQKTSLIATAYTPISSTSEPDRTQNIVRACELINGTVIEPGETFSFNNVVGARTEKNGFYKAIEYAYGKQQYGYGGGVCQVSSTIYWSAVRANMEIVKREQHALEVGYTEFGFDATVNYDGKKIDFVFRNTTDSPIYIITKVMLKPKVDKDHYLVICDIYGPALEAGVTYDIVAETVEVPVPEATVVPDTDAQYVIYTDDPPYTVPGEVGYEVDSYKVKYVNGEEVERTHLYHDTYKPVQPVTYVGVSERPLPTTTPWY